MTAIRLPQAPNYAKQAARCQGDEWPCIVCGRPIKDNTTAQNIHIAGGGSMVITDDDPLAGDSGDMDFFPIGSDCLRRHPELRPFVS